MWLAWLAATAIAAPGPFKIEDDNGDFVRLRFVGQIQAGLGMSSVADWEPVESIRFRRIRTILGTNTLDGRLKTGLQLNTVPGALEMLDMWGQVKAGDGVAVRFGQFKMNYTAYRAQSFTNLLLVDWPIATKHFGAERQVGVQVGDGAPGSDGFGWSLGAFAGSNVRESFATGVGTAYGTLVANPSDLAGGWASWTVHPELVTRVSTGSAGMNVKSSSDEEGGDLRWFTALSAAYDVAPDPTADFQLRLSPELMLKAGGKSVNLVGYMGFLDEMEPASAGGVAELGWRLAPEWGVAASYSRVQHLEALSDIDGVEAEQELGAGINAYIAGDAVKVQLDGAWLQTEAASTSDAARVRLQAHLAI